MQEILIDVKAVDEQVGAVVRCIETQPVLVRMLDQLGVDDGEVKAGRRLVGTESALDLLVDTAAIEHRQQMCELDGGYLANRQLAEVIVAQFLSIEPDTRPGQMGACDRAGEQLLMQFEQMRSVEVRRRERHVDCPLSYSATMPCAIRNVNLL